jgi:fibronectin type 3 domain-containing protein
MLQVAFLNASSPALVPGISDAEDPGEADWEGIVIPQVGVLPKVERHPSLYFKEDFIQTLKDRIAGKVPDPHGFYASRWARILFTANSYVNGVVSPNDDTKCVAAKALAFAWLMTDNIAYRDKAVAHLKAAFSSVQGSDQYVAMHMTNYVLAYDWVASSLNAAEDAAIRAAIKQGAVWLYDYLSPDGARNHNHRAKAGGALGSWALAFSSDSDAQSYLNRAMLNMHNVWKYMFTKDGIYRDGSGYYWTFTTINSTPFLWQYKNVSGVNLFEQMRPAFEWELKVSTPEGWLPNLEDGWYKICSLVTVAEAYRQTPTALSANGKLGELFQWRFFNSNWLPVRYDINWTGARNQYFGAPDEFVMYDSSIPETKPDAAAASLDFNAGPSGGATVLRNNWDYKNADTRYLYFEGTPMSSNHDHADALQFLIHAEKTILANDNGYGPQRFSGRAAYAGAPNHNVMTANGVALGDPLPSNIFLTSDGFDFVEKQAEYWYDTQKYASSPDKALHKRAIAFSGEDYFVVFDRGSAETSKTWENYYHNRGRLTGNGNQRVWTTPNNAWGEAAKMYAYMLPATMNIATGTSKFNPYGDGSWNDGTPYPSPASDVEDIPFLKMTQTGKTAQYLQILIPRSTTESAPRFTDLSGATTLGAKIELDAFSDLYLAKSLTTVASAGDLMSDAAFAHTRQKDGALHYWMMREGTSLNLAGNQLFSSTVPVSAVLNVADSALYKGKIIGEGSYTVQIRYTGNLAISQATFNGQIIIPAEVDGMLQFALSGSGDLEMQFVAARLPSIPSGVMSTDGEGRVILNWNGAALATSYSVYRKKAGGSYQLVASNLTTTSWTDETIANQNKYYYKVTAKNTMGESGMSSEVNAWPRPLPPVAPSGLGGSATAEGTIEIFWTDNANNELSYILERKDAESEFVELSLMSANTTTYSDSNLLPLTRYTYRLKAVNRLGGSDYSETIEVTTLPPTNYPVKPSEFTAVAFSSNQVLLAWKDNADNETGFEIERKIDDGIFRCVAKVASNVTAISDINLEPETHYTYRVRSINTNGQSFYSNEVEVTTHTEGQDSVANSMIQWVEAENPSNFSNFKPWSVEKDADASGSAYIVSSAQNIADVPADGRVVYSFDLPQDGTVSIWVRLITDGGTKDSLRMRVDSEAFTDWTSDFTISPDWYWVRWKDVPLKAGAHTVEMTYREIVKVDKLLFTTDNHYQPEGLGGAPESTIDRNQSIFAGARGQKLTQLGILDDTYYPWVRHEQHGWLYIVPSISSYLWYYDFQIEWIYTDFGYYPYLYSYMNEAWLWYYPGSSSPRWFYNFGINDWMSVEAPAQ